MYGWITVAVALIIMAVGYSLRNTFSVFYPNVVDKFGWERGSTALMFSISVLVYGLVAPLVGRLADRVEPRLLLSIGAVIAGGGVALCSLATSQWHFYLFYGLMGAIGLSMIGITPLGTMVIRWFPRKHGLAFGILSAGFGMSLVVAPFVQLLILRFGWQTAYVIMGILAIAVIVPLCMIFIRSAPHQTGLSSGGMPQISPESRGLHGSQKTGSLESKWSNNAWTLSRALKTRQLWLIFSISFCLMGLAEQTIFVHQVYFLKDVGYEPMLAASIYGVFGVAFVVGNLCSSFSDRVGRDRVFIPSCLLSTGAVSILFLISDASQPWMAFLFAVCCGLGLGAAPPVLFATVADLFHGKHLGSILGFVTLAFSLGGAISPWLAGFLYDTTGTYSLTFFILMGSLVMSAVLMWRVAPRRINLQGQSM